MGHHYVPQEYLRAFQTSANVGEIWLYDKKDRVDRTLPIRNVAQSPKFYDDDVERRLAAIEGRTNTVLTRVLASGSIGPDDRDTLAYYVAIMLYRSPRNRRKNVERIPEVRNKVLKNARDAIERWAVTRAENDPLVEQRRRELREAEEKFKVQPPREVMDQVRSPWPSEQVFDLVRQNTWRLLLATGRESFVTSDGPAVFFEGLGLGNPESEVTIPLSPTIAVIADHKGEPSSTLVFRVKTAMVREVNRRVVAHAERFVFAATPQAWVAKVAHKPHPYLSRIEWNV